MPEGLEKILKPIPAAMVRLVTLKLLMVRGFWLRPVIPVGGTGTCPCCGVIGSQAAFGICGECYRPVVRDALFGPSLLDHLALRAEIETDGCKEAQGKVASAEEQYQMPMGLAEILRPMSQKEAEAITVGGLVKFWRRPLIRSSAKSACPCCSGVHQLKAAGICSGCYSDKVLKNKLTGLALLEHLAVRAKGGIGRGRLAGQKKIKKSISPAPEPSSPAATPLAGAGQVECNDPGAQPHLILQDIRISLWLPRDLALSEIPKHIDKLIADLTSATAKVAELTQEVASLNRLLAKTPMDVAETDEEQGFAWSAAPALMSICTSLCLDQRTPLKEIVTHIGRLVEQRDMLEQERGDVAIALCAGEDDNLAMIALRVMDGAQRTVGLCAPATTEEAIVAKWSGLPVPDGYEALTDVMTDAIHQAAYGKGLERHADHRPFHDQPILRETQAVGLGFPAGQARKKILEAVCCCDDHPERAIADLLGAINYTAALVIAIRANRVEQAA
jgi:hypothetical protein